MICSDFDYNSLNIAFTVVAIPKTLKLKLRVLVASILFTSIMSPSSINWSIMNDLLFNVFSIKNRLFNFLFKNEKAETYTCYLYLAQLYQMTAACLGYGEAGKQWNQP